MNLRQLWQPRQLDLHRFGILLRRAGVEDDDVLVGLDPTVGGQLFEGAKENNPFKADLQQTLDHIVRFSAAGIRDYLKETTP